MKTLLCLLAMACSGAVAPMAPNAVSFTPDHAQYLTWWKQVEACSRHSRRMGEIDWYMVPDRLLFVYTDGQLYAGMYLPPDRIVLADWVTTSPEIVRHEMLHAILRHSAGHDPEYFVRRCGSLVAPSSEQPQ